MNTVHEGLVCFCSTTLNDEPPPKQETCVYGPNLCTKTWRFAPSNSFTATLQTEANMLALTWNSWGLKISNPGLSGFSSKLQPPSVLTSALLRNHRLVLGLSNALVISDSQMFLLIEGFQITYATYLLELLDVFGYDYLVHTMDLTLHRQFLHARTLNVLIVFSILP